MFVSDTYITDPHQECCTGDQSYKNLKSLPGLDTSNLCNFDSSFSYSTPIRHIFGHWIWEYDLQIQEKN